MRLTASKVGNVDSAESDLPGVLDPRRDEERAPTNREKRTMTTHVSATGFEPTEDLTAAAESLAAALADEAHAELTKIALEQMGEVLTAGIILAVPGQGSVVRHATARDWPGVLRELGQLVRSDLEARSGAVQ